MFLIINGNRKNIVAAIVEYTFATMLVPVLADIFKYKLVSSVLVLSCWSAEYRVKFMRQFNKHDIKATFSCDPNAIEMPYNHKIHGVLYFNTRENFTNEMKAEYFGLWNKWVIVGTVLPGFVNAKTRYDADIVLVKHAPMNYEVYDNTLSTTDLVYYIDDVYVHLTDGPTLHTWGLWTKQQGLVIWYDRERILRRLNLKKYPLTIAIPIGSYTNETYNGTFHEYITDETMPERDSGIRCGYMASSLIIETLNATEVTILTLLWGTEINNSSMTLKLRTGSADLAGGILRILPERVSRLDYAMAIWPFHVGFIYLAERESSSNMFAEPFKPSVWWCCLGLFMILALAQRATAVTNVEKEGAYIAVLATCLQQDASAVPAGISGRWAFLVLSVSAMLIHAYYTSAIVSALMSTGRNGPDSLRSLGDSKYAIASEDYDYMRFYLFDTKTNWSDLEYLKQKKVTPKLYRNIHEGVKLVQEGQTAYHTEFNQIYPHMKYYSDEEICKIQRVDTIPETLTWITATRWGQWKNSFRIAGAWLHEIGIAKRVVSRLRIRPSPCRASLLAERVNINDVAPMVILSLIGVFTSVIILLLENLIYKWREI